MRGGGGRKSRRNFLYKTAGGARGKPEVVREIKQVNSSRKEFFRTEKGIRGFLEYNDRFDRGALPSQDELRRGGGIESNDGRRLPILSYDF